MEEIKTTIWKSVGMIHRELWKQIVWENLIKSLSKTKDWSISQTVPWKYTQELLKDFPKVEKIEDFESLHKLVHNHLNFIKIETEEQKQKEQDIRWRRTWEQILEQKNVYQWKACTDITIAYMTLLHALGIVVSFVKVKNQKNIHSMLEVFFNGKFYIFDVAGKFKYTQTSFKKGEKLWDWTFWGKWNDSWDLWLCKFWDTISD